MRTRVSLILLLTTLLACSFSQVRAAEDPVIFFDKVESEFVSPDKWGPTRPGGSSRPAKWVLIEFNYTVTPANKAEYVDEVQFKANIEGDSATKEDRTQTPVMLTAEVTYMMVPAGKGFGSFYISPDVAARYHLTENLSKFNINIQAFVGGQKVDAKDKKRDEENWYSKYPTVAGLVLTKVQSPFILNDADRYPTIKPKQGN